MNRKHARIGVLATMLTISTLFFAGCGSSGGSSDDSQGTTVTELVWDAAATSYSVTAGETLYYTFTAPANLDQPSAQIVVTSGGPVDAYMCRVVECGPDYPGNAVNDPWGIMI